MKSRSLTRTEMAALESRGCSASDWSRVTVTEGFSTDNLLRVRFRGKVRIGSMKVADPVNGDEASGTPGIYEATLENCEIGDRVHIDRVGLIRNYCVLDDAVIENVDEISAGLSSFGNGVEVSVMNEAGGREIPIFDRMGAQLAYLMVFYRHDRRLQEVLGDLVRNYVRLRSSEWGSIGKGAVIRNSGILRDMWIGDSALINGVSLLENGTLLSKSIAPVEIGEGVNARDFIVQSGSRILSGAILEKCFVGQGVSIGKQFSAVNSLFFSNCEAFHGEAVSVFAGPYTVSHHKANLLIAGMFSFFNAGSGTNQSNHMYKLGPVHQGIVERGSKTGSSAYLLWPTRVGPFTVILGKNMSSFDSGDFPFSYITLERERSLLTPGIYLGMAGPWRDSMKWRSRDRRRDPELFDQIRSDLLTPFVVGKILRGMDLLSSLDEKTPPDRESVLVRGLRIKRLMLKSNRRYYEQALTVFAGQQLVGRLEGISGKDDIDSIRIRLTPSSGLKPGVDGAGLYPERWIDMAGMIAPAYAVDDLVAGIREGRYIDLEQIRVGLEEIHDSYERYAWDYTTGILSERFGIDIETIETGQLIELIGRWEKDAIRLKKMILNDAAREFEGASRIGYGIDGDDGVMEADFSAVRGTAEGNSYMVTLRKEIGEIESQAAELKGFLGNLN